MPTSTEIFINSELPKRPYTNQFPLTSGHVPVATGVGLQVEARALTTSDISGMSNYATQGDLSNVLAGLWDDRGAYTVNAAGNINYPSSAGSGVAGALMKGDIFTVAGAVAGISTINNIAVNNGDTVRALVDNPSATDNAHWAIAENNIGYVPENRANKTTNTDLSGATGTYPDTPTVKSYIDNYDISAASISSTGTVTLTRTASNLTFQVPTAISGLSFDANTGVLTSSYTNNATSTTITVAANEVSDNVFRIKDNDDATKKIAFEASGIATGETRTITMPDTNVDLGKVAQAASASSNGYLTSADWSSFSSRVETVSISSGSFTAAAGRSYLLLVSGSCTLNLDALDKDIEIRSVSSVGQYNITLSGFTRTYKNESGTTITSFTLSRGYSVRIFPVGILSARVYKSTVVQTSDFALLKSGGDTTRLTVDMSTMTASRVITMPDTDVNLGNVAQAASTSANGYLTKTDWDTFNGKQAALVSGTNIRTVNGYSLLGSGNVTIDRPNVVRIQQLTSSFTYPVLTTTPPQIYEITVYATSLSLNVGNMSGTSVLRFITDCTISLSGADVYKLIDGTVASSYSAKLGETVVLYQSGTTIYIAPQHWIPQSRYKLWKDSTSNISVNLDALTGSVTHTYPNKNINFGDLSFVASTNSNTLSGTGTHIIGGSNNKVSGTNVVAVGCDGCDLSLYTDGVTAIGVLNTTNSYAVAPRKAILLGSSALTTSIFNISGAHAAALGVIQCVYSNVCSANGTTFNATLDGVNTPSSTNCIKLLPSASVLSSAVIDLDFIIVVGDNMSGALLAPRRTVFAKRRVYIVYAFNDSDVATFNSSVEVIGTDTSVGSAATGTVTVGVTVDSANNRLIPTVSATSGSKQTLFQFGVRSTAHYNRNV